MRARLVSPLVRPTPVPLALGLVVAASLIVAETLAASAQPTSTHNPAMRISRTTSGTAPLNR
jgi:hypothetical protein